LLDGESHFCKCQISIRAQSVWKSLGSFNHIMAFPCICFFFLTTNLFPGRIRSHVPYAHKRRRCH
jgi:hypothetical protein